MLAGVLMAGAAGCAGTPGPEASTTSTTSSPATTTVTVTSTVPAPSPTTPKAPATSPQTPPPAKDPLVIPDNPRDYAAAFVRAWVERNGPHLSQLGTPAAVSAVTGSTVDQVPTLRSCDGAAGSTYCTWEGVEYTLTVRVLNEPASQREQHAVTEARFAH